MLPNGFIECGGGLPNSSQLGERGQPIWSSISPPHLTAPAVLEPSGPTRHGYPPAIRGGCDCDDTGGGGGEREEKERGLSRPAGMHARPRRWRLVMTVASWWSVLFWKENQTERKRDTPAYELQWGHSRRGATKHGKKVCFLLFEIPEGGFVSFLLNFVAENGCRSEGCEITTERTKNGVHFLLFLVMKDLFLVHLHQEFFLIFSLFALFHFCTRWAKKSILR